MIGTLLLNRYEILEKIGEGGMGVVYKARCHMLNRIVAIKVLKPEMSKDKIYIERFKREATSTAVLSHPNIINIHDVGTENNINFIVMEYVNGKTLKQIIKEESRLRLSQMLDISIQTAKALCAAHKNNIIHRDIKSDNILIAEDGNVKVADFGIAKMADAVTICNSNKVIGSAYYFSPEQAKGRVVDNRTDIYSLGVVMYEMITGQVPYNAENSISVAMMHINGQVVPPEDIIADIHPEINQVILKALNKELSDRYQTAKEMVQILEEIQRNINSKVSRSDTTIVMNPVSSSACSYQKQYNSTVILSGSELNESVRKNLKKSRKSFYKEKKTLIILCSIILLLIFGATGKKLIQNTDKDIPAPDTQAIASQTASEEVAEKTIVPTVVGQTRDSAIQLINDYGFQVGNMSNEYSETIPKDSVISQSPKENTAIEKGGKIDFVISLGKMITQVTVPDLRGRTVNEAQTLLAELQLELGEASPITFKNKGNKRNSLGYRNGEILMQDTEAGTVVNQGSKIKVSYYRSK